MKKEDLFEGFAALDDELLKRSEQGGHTMKKQKNLSTFIKYGGIAACLLVALSVGALLLNKNIKNTEPGNSTVVESPGADYPATIMVDNQIYALQITTTVEVDEGNILGYTTSYTDGYPTQNGETNFNRTLNMPYASVEGGIAVYYENQWHLCVPK